MGDTVSALDSAPGRHVLHSGGGQRAHDIQRRWSAVHIRRKEADRHAFVLQSTFTFSSTMTPAHHMRLAAKLPCFGLGKTWGKATIEWDSSPRSRDDPPHSHGSRGRRGAGRHVGSHNRASPTMFCCLGTSCIALPPLGRRPLVCSVPTLAVHQAYCFWAMCWASR